MKCYNIVKKTDNSAELNLYGEVVKTRPIDWWTGKPVPGDFIIQDEIMKDLDELTGIDSLTVRINSVGGDYYAGVAIRNRIRDMGIRVDTVNDSLAASAGSIIMQAAGNGGKRKVFTTSSMMVHQVSGYMRGYYNRTELKKAVKELDTADELAAICYAESGTVSKEDAAAAMEEETWMTGEQAVEKGFADEVIVAGQAKEVVLDNQYQMRTGGMLFNAGWLRNCASLPNNIKKVENLTPEAKGENEMEKFNNLAELKAAYPQFVAEAEEAARNAAESQLDERVNNAVNQAVAQERQRMQQIDEIAGAVTDRAMVNDAKYTNPVSAEKFAFNMMKQQAQVRKNALDDIVQDAGNSGAGNVTAAAAANEEDAEKAEALANIARFAEEANKRQ